MHSETLTAFIGSMLFKLNEHIPRCFLVLNRRNLNRANSTSDIGGPIIGQFQARRFILSN